MADIFLVRHHGVTLVPAHDSDREAIKILPHGEHLRAKITRPRNLKFHRKFFAMINMGFDYWTPKSFVQEIERKTVGNLGKFMVNNGVDRESARNLCKEFLKNLNEKRQYNDLEKSEEYFRQWVLIRAGYFDKVQTPSGPKKIAKSISFANMGEDEFNGVYKNCFNVIWHLILSKTFATEEEAENAINNLLAFD